MKQVLMAFAMFIAIIIIGCSKGGDQVNSSTPPPPPSSPPASLSCDGVNAKFSQVSPIIQNSCATGSGCHGNGSTNGPGPLTNFDLIKNAAFSIKSAVVSGRMPKGGSLSAADIKIISCWVDGGAVND